ncbi:phosphotransferase [Nonomuraea sp. NPDC026600]|uniref:phosphotransferase family protein n=1 Tax=Nonomuraea sp. NPDC026600 TaxID=3155363 RepID=UPI0034017168
MIYVKTPLTREIREAVALTWGVTGEGERLHGGEESAAYRLDGHVIRPGPRPVPAFQESGLYGDPPQDAAELDDPDLDRWLAAFHAEHPMRHPLHGDYYTGNTLARDGRIVAVLDWDETFVGAPELELAAAALEWGDDLAGPSEEFVAAYHQAGGTAARLDEESLAQLVRHKLRREHAYFHKAVRSGVTHDEADVEYHRARVELFHGLRP